MYHVTSILSQTAIMPLIGGLLLHSKKDVVISFFTLRVGAWWKMFHVAKTYQFEFSSNKTFPCSTPLRCNLSRRPEAISRHDWHMISKASRRVLGLKIEIVLKPRKQKRRKEWTAEQPLGKRLKKLHVNTSETSNQHCSYILWARSFPESWIAWVKFLLFVFWQLRSSLAPPSADPHGTWKECRQNNAQCNSSQIQFLQGRIWNKLSFAWLFNPCINIQFDSELMIHIYSGLSFLCYKTDFRNQMLDAIKVFSSSNQNGLFINSCFAHCQSERQDTWFADDSPRIGNKVWPINFLDRGFIVNVE